MISKIVGVLYLQMMKGLYEKYYIAKTDGSPVDDGADYFVMRLDSDPHARKGALAYADSIKEQNPHLAFEIQQRVATYEGGMFNGRS